MSKAKVANTSANAKPAAKARLHVELSATAAFDPHKLLEQMRIELQSFATSAGLFVMRELMRLESEQRAGAPYERHSDIDRWGTQSGFVRLGGQKVEIERPRLRSKSKKKEEPLETYRAFQDPERQAEQVYNSLIGGLSGRRYEQTVEQIVEGYGVSKSAVSRTMVAATAARVKELLERDLSSFDVRVLVIDAVRVGGSVHATVLGIDAGGSKMVLGFREGATENSVVVTELLEDLIGRGLPNEPERRLLAVVDGGKALAKALRTIYGKRVEIQRCQVHKLRNVLDYLPEQYRTEYRRKISAAYAMRSHADAKRALEQVIRDLKKLNVSAAASLEEGLEETLTVHKLDLPEELRRSLRSTNMIESIFSNSRHMMRNVKRWRGSEHTQRWTATVLLEAEKKFRRIQGHDLMKTLIEALAKSLN